MRYIPDFITSLNLASGFIAIIFATYGDLLTASWFILGAMIFDFLDGFSARLLKAYSDIGKELDSLADVVSFGVAPGLIIFRMLGTSFLFGATNIVRFEIPGSVLILLISVIMPVCAALRLAKFNIDTTQATAFKGLPTPANALAVISLVFAVHYSHSTIFAMFIGSPVLVIAFSLILSLMMISRIKLLSLKVSDLNLKGNEGRLILGASLLVSFAFFGIAAAPFIIPLYILASLLSMLF